MKPSKEELRYSEDEHASFLLEHESSMPMNEQGGRSARSSRPLKLLLSANAILLAIQSVLLASWVHGRYFVLNPDLRRISTFSMLAIL